MEQKDSTSPALDSQENCTAAFAIAAAHGEPQCTPSSLWKTGAVKIVVTRGARRQHLPSLFTMLNAFVCAACSAR
jgi:hypothetical protein